MLEMHHNTPKITSQTNYRQTGGYNFCVQAIVANKSLVLFQKHTDGCLAVMTVKATLYLKCILKVFQYTFSVSLCLLLSHTANVRRDVYSTSSTP